jgi:hypothetical protein
VVGCWGCAGRGRGHRLRPVPRPPRQGRGRPLGGAQLGGRGSPKGRQAPPNREPPRLLHRRGPSLAPNFKRHWQPAVKALGLPPSASTTAHVRVSVSSPRRQLLHRPARRRLAHTEHDAGLCPPRPRDDPGRRRPARLAGRAPFSVRIWHRFRHSGYETTVSRTQRGGVSACVCNGAPGGIRTPDPRLRRPFQRPMLTPS